MADQPQQSVQAAAFVEETFMPGVILVEEQEAQPGVVAHVKLKMFLGPVSPGVFMCCKVAQLEPKPATTIGEALADSGKKVDTGGIEIPVIGMPRDLHTRH